MPACWKLPASLQWGPPARVSRSVWGSPTMRECLPGKQRWTRPVGLPARYGYRSAWTPKNGYGHTPEEVAETIRRVADTGAVGASIEDYAAAYGTGELYDRILAAERIEAAATTAASLPFPFTLTARAECYLVGHPNPFGESVARATSYREAGADCLYVPGIADAETIGRFGEGSRRPASTWSWALRVPQ